ncbi:MAG: ACP S-malonyltransferase [Candidatus Adiutrix sp.]|jgi:[acyl-carrier-protein] S-malonyltransferase|nr:ACP S-malonyltransferase [Candidatus Adiutrix sp.]
MPIAFIFPGQGGQFVGQARSWLDRDPALSEILALADEVSGRPVTRLCLEGPLEELSKTANLQPAVVATSLMGHRLMRAAGLKPDFACGHSLGEFSALCAAGVFDERTALALVSRRGAIMEEAALKNPGAMTAILGLSAEDLGAVCELARNEGPVVMANFNTPDQIVISGDIRAVAAAGKYVKMKNGKVLPLPLSGAFHSPLMAAAQEKFAAELEKTDFRPPTCQVVPNSTARPTDDPAEIKARLLTQMTSPVLWTQTVQTLAEAGVTDFREAWPKPYLTSLIKKSLPRDTAPRAEAFA